MIRFASGMILALFLFAGVPSGWCQQYYLYTPTAVETEGQTGSKDGVLVQEVTVHKGDTLSGISRKFSGRGSYFPQILLFNDIRNPNKIYPGDVFKIPVTRNNVTGHNKVTEPIVNVPGHVGQTSEHQETTLPSVQKQTPAAPSAAPVTDISINDLKKVGPDRGKKRASRVKTGEPAKKAVTGESTSGQKLFERAVTAYRSDDYRTALELFDKYLTENQASPLAADASLYKAECYLKLSTQN